MMSLKMKDQVDSCLETIIFYSIYWYTHIYSSFFSALFFGSNFKWRDMYLWSMFYMHGWTHGTPTDLDSRSKTIVWNGPMGVFEMKVGKHQLLVSVGWELAPFFWADCPRQRIFGIGDWRLHPAKPAKSWIELRGVCSARPGGLGSCGWGERTKNNGPGRIRASKMVGSKPSGLQINDASSIGQLVLTVQNSAAPMILLS